METPAQLAPRFRSDPARSMADGNSRKRGDRHDLRRRRRPLRERCPTAAAGAAASICRRSRSASGTTSAASTTTRSAAPSSAAPSTSASPTSTSPTTTARPRARPRRTSAASSRADFRPYRDELIISTKAGYDMWPGPYGEWGSRKYLIASLDQSLRRMGLDYVDIFYTTAPTPTRRSKRRWARSTASCRQGKALYVGISNYPPSSTREAARILQDMGVPSSSTSRATRCSTAGSRTGCSTRSRELGIGCIAFSPLAQGLLTDKYLDGIPSRLARRKEPLAPSSRITPDAGRAAEPAQCHRQARGQTLAQLALTWVLRRKGITSALIGARTRGAARRFARRAEGAGPLGRGDRRDRQGARVRTARPVSVALRLLRGRRDGAPPPWGATRR